MGYGLTASRVSAPAWSSRVTQTVFSGVSHGTAQEVTLTTERGILVNLDTAETFFVHPTNVAREGVRSITALWIPFSDANRPSSVWVSHGVAPSGTRDIHVTRFF